LRANILTSTVLSLRGENFRWADLVSGNLKEENNALTPPYCCIQVALGTKGATCCSDTLQSRNLAAEPGFVV
jgi:hypothetical protein